MSSAVSERRRTGRLPTRIAAEAHEVLTWIGFGNAVYATSAADIPDAVYGMTGSWPVEPIALFDWRFAQPLALEDFPSGLWPGGLGSLRRWLEARAAPEECTGFLVPKDNDENETLLIQAIAFRLADPILTMYRTPTASDIQNIGVTEWHRHMLKATEALDFARRVAMEGRYPNENVAQMLSILDQDIAQVDSKNSALRSATELLCKNLSKGNIISSHVINYQRKNLSPTEWSAGLFPCIDGKARIMGNYSPKFEDLLFETSEILSLWPPGSALDIDPMQPNIATKRVENRPTGGRPRLHDWESFFVEACAWLFQNATPADEHQRTALQKHMEAWTGEQWQNPPTDSTIRAKLKQALQGERT